MKYMLLLYASEASTADFTPEQYEQVSAEKWFALMQEMKAAGVLLDNNGLCANCHRDHRARARRQDADHRRSVRRDA